VAACSQFAKHAYDPEYICNPGTGRYVLKDGRIGRQLMRQLANWPAKQCRGKLRLDYRGAMTCNPVTGKFVATDNYVGWSREKQTSYLSSGRRPCKEKTKGIRGRTVCNPATGYWVKADSRIGKRVRGKQ
jgi:hypothetical protein